MYRGKKLQSGPLKQKVILSCERKTPTKPAVAAFCLTFRFGDVSERPNMDRDLNASKNILRIGMDSLRDRDIPIEAPTPLG